MPVAVLAAALVSILFSAFAQLVMKIGMTKIRAMGPLAGTDAVMAVATSPYVIGGLGLYGIGAMMWLSVLSRVPLSAAYPLVSLGFVFVALMGWGILGETMPFARVAGIGLILAGVVLVGSST